MLLLIAICPKAILCLQNLKKMLIGQFLYFCVLLLAGTASSVEEYKIYDFATCCPLKGGKRVINLKTGTAIFVLDQSSQVTKNILEEREISCHLELEIPSTNYGFHVFFDEMNLDENENSVLEGPKPKTCNDYVQFGRDVLYFTTSKSRKYCGYRERLFYHNATEFDYARASRQGSRLFIEKNDSEMDVWLSVKRNKDRQRKSKRILRIIVTVFKKVCSDNDLYWRKCVNSRYCVRKGLYCDNYANCGWPDGERATDETKKLCAEVWRKNSEISGIGTVFSPSNIPIIIVVTIIVTAILVIFVIALVRFVRAIHATSAKPNDDGSSPSGNPSRRANRGIRSESGRTRGTRSRISPEQRALTPTASSRASSDDTEITPVLLHHTDPGGALPSAPPSYDEAMQVPYAPSAPAIDRSDPPPYTTAVT